MIHDPIGDHTHLLNRTAARVAELCDGRHTMREIGAILEREFPVALTDEVDLVDEATAIVAELKRAGLVEETGA